MAYDATPAGQPTLLRTMDLNLWAMMRDTVRAARGELRETPAFTLCLHRRASPFHSMALVHDAVDPDELLAAIADFHGRRGAPFSIWTRAHADQALETTLLARGFSVFVSLPAMALLADPGTACAPAGLTIRVATTDAGRRDYLAVSAEAYASYGQAHELTADLFCALESVYAPHVQGFVGYRDGTPVAAALVYLSHGIAGINWVGTVSAARGRRFAEAVTWAAVREGFARGAVFANLQASPMGRPVYERMGFVTPSAYRVLLPAT